MEEWRIPYIANANEVLEFKLVQNVEDLENEKTVFKPDMSHQVFGENEIIFGYQNLKVRLYYSAGSLKTYLGMTYTSKIPPELSDGKKPDNIFQQIIPWISPNYTTNMDVFVSSLKQDQKFKPQGHLMSSFSIYESGRERYFEVYKGDTKNKQYLGYHERLRTFAIWYIDAANYVDTQDDKWTFFNVYERYQTKRRAIRYSSAGYATIYAFYAHPGFTRPRIAQFLILPPFQAIGLGARFLKAIYSYYAENQNVVDITVEVPSQAFQRVRDFVDVDSARLLSSFAKHNLANGFSDTMAREARDKLKLNRKQARRVYEILRLMVTDVSDEFEYRRYRLDVKNRLNVSFRNQQINMEKKRKTIIVLPKAEQRMKSICMEYRDLKEEYRKVIKRLKKTNGK